MNEADLIAKLRKVEALFAGATTAGERAAAGRARERILERLLRAAREDPPVEFKFTMPDQWSRRVFLALCRRYELEPYRRYRQRRTTVLVRAPASFVDGTLWPEFLEIDKELRAYLGQVTDRVVASVLHADSSDADVVEPERLT